MTREEILNAAKKCVCGGREEDYGKPEDSFGLIGRLWSDYLGAEITAKDVAVLMALLKIARIKTDVKSDSYVDLAGYAACAGELAKCDDRDGEYAPVTESESPQVKTLRDIVDEKWPGHRRLQLDPICPNYYIKGVPEPCGNLSCADCWSRPWENKYELREDV